MRAGESVRATLAGDVVLDALKLSAGGGATRVASRVIDEDVLTVDIAGVGRYALMWTPTRQVPEAAGYTRSDGVLAGDGMPERLALAAGFAYTEGIIDGLADIEDMAICAEQSDVVRMRLARPPAAPRRRDVIVDSACGLCGGRERLEEALPVEAPMAASLYLRADDFPRLLDAFRRRQRVFASTGGAHAAMVFDRHLEPLAFAEDLGRHNALDKVIGQCLLEGRPLRGLGVLVSSRLSYEMVTKSARAGFEVVAAISAPTSLAVEIAQRAGMTLCAFVRGEGLEVYSGPERIAMRGTSAGFEPERRRLFR